MQSYFHWMNTTSLLTLSRGYLKEGIPQANLKEAAIERVRTMCDAAEAKLRKMGMPEDLINGYGYKLFEYASRGWISFSSPIWSNFAAGRGLPISCNGSFMDDTTGSILWKNAEIGAMTKNGAGTSLYVGALRPEGAPISTGGFSKGRTHFLRLTQEMVTVISQSSIRRGNLAAYEEVTSPEIYEFLKQREKGNPLQHLSFGVCIGDDWMEEMMAEAKGGEKRLLMARIVNKRRETGFPYIFFKDAANRGRHPRLVEMQKFIWASNLCTEVMLPSSGDESFVCDLSSLNLAYYDDWKNTDLVEMMIWLLDAVME